MYRRWQGVITVPRLRIRNYYVSSYACWPSSSGIPHSSSSTRGFRRYPTSLSVGTSNGNSGNGIGGSARHGDASGGNRRRHGYASSEENIRHLGSTLKSGSSSALCKGRKSGNKVGNAREGYNKERVGGSSRCILHSHHGGGATKVPTIDETMKRRSVEDVRISVADKTCNKRSSSFLFGNIALTGPRSCALDTTRLLTNREMVRGSSGRKGVDRNSGYGSRLLRTCVKARAPCLMFHFQSTARNVEISPPSKRSFTTTTTSSTTPPPPISSATNTAPYTTNDATTAAPTPPTTTTAIEATTANVANMGSRGKANGENSGGEGEGKAEGRDRFARKYNDGYSRIRSSNGVSRMIKRLNERSNTHAKQRHLTRSMEMAILERLQGTLKMLNASSSLSTASSTTSASSATSVSSGTVETQSYADPPPSQKLILRSLSRSTRELGLSQEQASEVFTKCIESIAEHMIQNQHAYQRKSHDDDPNGRGSSGSLVISLSLAIIDIATSRNYKIQKHQLRTLIKAFILIGAWRKSDKIYRRLCKANGNRHDMPSLGDIVEACGRRFRQERAEQGEDLRGKQCLDDEASKQTIGVTNPIVEAKRELEGAIEEEVQGERRRGSKRATSTQSSRRTCVEFLRLLQPKLERRNRDERNTGNVELKSLRPVSLATCKSILEVMAQRGEGEIAVSFLESLKASAFRDSAAALMLAAPKKSAFNSQPQDHCVANTRKQGSAIGEGSSKQKKTSAGAEGEEKEGYGHDYHADDFNSYVDARNWWQIVEYAVIAFTTATSPDNFSAATRSSAIGNLDSKHRMIHHSSQSLKLLHSVCLWWSSTPIILSERVNWPDTNSASISSAPKSLKHAIKEPHLIHAIIKGLYEHHSYTSDRPSTVESFVKGRGISAGGKELGHTGDVNSKAESTFPEIEQRFSLAPSSSSPLKAPMFDGTALTPLKYTRGDTKKAMMQLYNQMCVLYPGQHFPTLRYLTRWCVENDDLQMGLELYRTFTDEDGLMKLKRLAIDGNIEELQHDIDSALGVSTDIVTILGDHGHAKLIVKIWETLMEVLEIASATTTTTTTTTATATTTTTTTTTPVGDLPPTGLNPTYRLDVASVATFLAAVTKALAMAQSDFKPFPWQPKVLKEVEQYLEVVGVKGGQHVGTDARNRDLTNQSHIPSTVRPPDCSQSHDAIVTGEKQSNQIRNICSKICNFIIQGSDRENSEESVLWMLHTYRWALKRGLELRASVHYRILRRMCAEEGKVIGEEEEDMDIGPRVTSVIDCLDIMTAQGISLTTNIFLMVLRSCRRRNNQDPWSQLYKATCVFGVYLDQTGLPPSDGAAKGESAEEFSTLEAKKKSRAKAKSDVTANSNVVPEWKMISELMYHIAIPPRWEFSDVTSDSLRQGLEESRGILTLPSSFDPSSSLPLSTSRSTSSSSLPSTMYVTLDNVPMTIDSDRIEKILAEAGVKPIEITFSPQSDQKSNQCATYQKSNRKFTLSFGSNEGARMAMKSLSEFGFHARMSMDWKSGYQVMLKFSEEIDLILPGTGTWRQRAQEIPESALYYHNSVKLWMHMGRKAQMREESCGNAQEIYPSIHDYTAMLMTQMFSCRFEEAYELWSSIPEQLEKEKYITLNRIALYTSGVLQRFDTMESLVRVTTEQNEKCLFDVVESLSVSSHSMAFDAFSNLKMAYNDVIPPYFAISARGKEWKVDISQFSRVTSTVALEWFMERVLTPALEAWNDDNSVRPPRVIIYVCKYLGASSRYHCNERNAFVLEYLKSLQCPLQETEDANAIALSPDPYLLRQWATTHPWETSTGQFLIEAIEKDPRILHDWMYSVLPNQ